eukprot:TRINITY_DN10278_c0_g1_i1.p1 TRINITY_DN10278_c0_g1~~TRINITY_DN10278_c0_g1_i1.p1  ORF type:complete len:277 (+),score=56.95 TRINITY_DN10278_c0_g1_i1:238-1068(+)
MGNGPPPFAQIGSKVKDLLTRDYHFDQKFTLMVLGDNELRFATTGVKKDNLFTGDLSTLYKSGNTTVNVKIDTSSKVSTTVIVDELIPCTRTALSFEIPDHKSGKLDMQYLNASAAISSSIGLTPTPRLELAATVGSKDLCFGAEIGFDTASASFTKYNAGIGFDKQDFSASLILADKGETLKASYIHNIDPIKRSAVAAEMTHKFTTYENRFNIGGSQALDHFTTLKARLNDSGKVAILCQRVWRPKSVVTFSAEFDPKAPDGASRFGLALSLQP